MSAPAERLKMSEAWRQWEGEVVDERFLLQRFLGSSDHSAVFLTEIGQPPQKAALKFIEATAAGAPAQLSRWETASKLSHPHLIRILHFGGCRLGRASMLYVISEFAEENLSQILPVRALSPAEAEYMLRSVIEALAYLHGQGLVHGHLKPSNVMAVDEKLKISSDGVCGTKEKLPNWVRTIYDPPEATTSGPSPAADVWSLGLTLVEALTQKPSWGEGLRQGDSLLPETVPPPFGEIARQCLRLDPQRRLTVSDIAARLLPTAPPPQKGVASRYGIAAAVLAVILGGVIVGQRFLSKGPESRSPQEQVSQPAPQAPSAGSQIKSPSAEQHTAIPGTQVPTAPPGTAEGNAPNASPEPKNAMPSASPEPKNEPPVSPVVVPAPAVPPSTRARSTPGEVKERFLPSVPRRSLSTISGHVRVTVKADVDSSGKVTRAHLESPGPSHYFAKLAQDSASHWKFTPPQQNGQAVPSQWFLRYTFGRSGTEVHPTQVAPRQ
jgi:eukaryotic-like serine/threonine-protein kinase